MTCRLAAGRAALLFAILVQQQGCAGGEVSDLQAAYEKAVRDAAIRSSSEPKPLNPVDIKKPRVWLAHFGRNTRSSGQKYTTKSELWVSQAEELRQRCAGRRNPTLALEQVLGLPPDLTSGHTIALFQASPRNLFRPCASDPDVTRRQCSLTLSERRDPKHDRSEHFVLRQMLQSYREGQAGTGYPFTAMGWTYNWDPDSSSPQGVSEYVLEPGATVWSGPIVTPEQFCQPEGRSSN